MTWWHAGASVLTEIRPILHVGTMAQAGMRGGGRCRTTRVTIGPANIMRRRDVGSWNARSLMRAMRGGVDAIVYLNRYEGVPIEEFDDARGKADLDRVDDVRFRRIVPSAADSLIILRPGIILSIDDAGATDQRL